MKAVYFGSDEFGLPTLAALAESAGHELVGVVSQPDRPAGRGRHLHPTPVSTWAAERGCPLLRADRVRDPATIARIAEWGGQVGVVVAFGQKIPNELLAAFPHGCLNLHASLLPALRGAAPIAWAIVNGETRTGVTVFRLVEQMDAGPIVCQQETEIAPTETAGELAERLARMGPHVVGLVLDQLADGSARFFEQNHMLATKAPKLTKADAAADWNQPAAVIARRIRGFYPWPGVHALFLGRSGRSEKVVLARAEARSAAAIEQAGVEVGTVRDDLTVAAGLGTVRLLDVKPAGGRLMSFTDFVNGRRVRPGDRFLPTPAPSLPNV